MTLPNLVYDEAERRAMSRLSNRAIEACSPAAFNYTSYPTRVSGMEELWRYADVMHDRRARGCFDMLNGLTPHEGAVWVSAIHEAANITEFMCRRIVPRNAPLAALVAYRIINSFYETPPSVFEVGPGSGYLGKYLVLDGARYTSTDVTQAFCLWQNIFLGAAQIPWWNWIDHNREDFSVDVIVANHALNELSENALRYLIVRAERMLGNTGILIAEQLGAGYLRNEHQTSDIFTQRNWKQHGVHGYKCSVFVPPGSELPQILKIEDRNVTWDDIEATWQKLGAVPNPDDEFLDFIGSALQ